MDKQLSFFSIIYFCLYCTFHASWRIRVRSNIDEIYFLFCNALAELNEPEDFDLGKLIEEEEMSSGSVPIRVYFEFIKAAVWVVVLLTLVLYCLTQSLHMTADFFLSEMVSVGTQIKEEEMLNNTTAS